MVKRLLVGGDYESLKHIHNYQLNIVQMIPGLLDLFFYLQSVLNLRSDNMLITSANSFGLQSY